LNDGWNKSKLHCSFVKNSKSRSYLLAVGAFFCFLGGATAQSEPGGGPTPLSEEHAQAPNGVTPSEPRGVSWRSLVPNLLDDQRQIWTFPLTVAEGKHWVPTLAITGVTAGLIALDPHDTPYFRRTNNFVSFNQVFSGTATAAATAIVPASFYLIGLKRHNTYAQQTALFAGESLADAEILTVVVKAVTRRTRPSSIPPGGDFSDTWFKTGWGSSFSGAASFPSGHTIAAFSVATVIARRYGSHHWVPWVAYGLAGLVGFSRVTNQAHFPSDVFLGAALGYSVSRFAVLRH
jgi:membrane-associated phospholipid phosphatase